MINIAVVLCTLCYIQANHGKTMSARWIFIICFALVVKDTKYEAKWYNMAAYVIMSMQANCNYFPKSFPNSIYVFFGMFLT